MTPQDAPHYVPQDEKRVGYLFGYPIKHSLSPIVHQLVYKHLGLDYTYTLHESTDIQSFLELTQAPNFYGAAVTMPYKVSIIPHLSTLTPEGLAVGAINTIFLSPSPSPSLPDPRSPGHQQQQQLLPRQLHGTNTDCIGIREALRQNMPPASFAACAHKPALVIGGGGTSRAAVYALHTWLHSAPIYMLNRDAAEVAAVMAECTARGFGGVDLLVHVESYAQVRAWARGPAVVVSAIPDFEPRAEGEVLVRECLGAVLARGGGREEGEGRGKGTLLEMCYHPSPDTAISRLAVEAGWDVIPGTEAMVWQGLEQDRYWTGRDVEDMPVEEVKAAVAEALENARAHT